MSVCTPKSFDLTGKVALITGASYGIGFAIATAMANCGATIVFNDIKQELVDKGLAAYKEAGVDAHGYVADVTDEAAVNAMVAKIKEEVGPVDILVNNAGLMKRVPMIEMSHADFMRVIDVHVGGAFNCSKAVLPDMMEKREGKIITICSMMICGPHMYPSLHPVMARPFENPFTTSVLSRIPGRDAMETCSVL